MKFLIILGTCAVCLVGCVSAPITSANYTESNSNKSINDLRSRVGNQYWFPLRKSVSTSFIVEPISNYRKVPHDGEKQFSIVDFLWIDQHRTYYKVEFDSGKIAWTDAFLFNLQGEASFFREDPKIVLDRKIESEKQSMEINRSNKSTEIAEILKANRLEAGATIWLKYRKYGVAGLKKIQVKGVSVTEDKYPEVELLCEIDGKDKPIRIGPFALVQNSPSLYLGAFHFSDPAKSTASWGKAVLKSINEGKVSIGMTEDQALTSWGPPNRINQSGGKWGTHVQWVYRDHGPYLYFENGKLTSWQN